MHTTLLDTVTGKRVEAPEWNGTVFWWTEGNGSCDCNRALAMGCGDLENKVGDQEVCLGHARFLVVDVHGDLEGHERAELVQLANAAYPVELVERHVK